MRRLNLELPALKAAHQSLSIIFGVDDDCSVWRTECNVGSHLRQITTYFIRAAGFPVNQFDICREGRLLRPVEITDEILKYRRHPRLIGQDVSEARAGPSRFR